MPTRWQIPQIPQPEPQERDFTLQRAMNLAFYCETCNSYKIRTLFLAQRCNLNLLLFFFSVLKFTNNFNGVYTTRVYFVILGTMDFNTIKLLSPAQQVNEVLERLFALEQTIDYNRPYTLGWSLIFEILKFYRATR